MRHAQPGGVLVSGPVEQGAAGGVAEHETPRGWGISTERSGAPTPGTAMRADRVPASLTPAQGYVGMPCPTCFAVVGERCVMWNQHKPAKMPHAARRRIAVAAAWWHCFGEAP